MLYVPMKRAKKRSWSAAKEALVAMRRVGVGPGVKMDSQRSSKNLPAMVSVCEVECEGRGTSDVVVGTWLELVRDEGLA
jgi:hypothetical protein